jgi:hypothetical protein
MRKLGRTRSRTESGAVVREGESKKKETVSLPDGTRITCATIEL